MLHIYDEFSDKRFGRLLATAAVATHLDQHHPTMEGTKSKLLLAIEMSYSVNLV